MPTERGRGERRETKWVVLGMGGVRATKATKLFQIGPTANPKFYNGNAPIILCAL